MAPSNAACRKGFREISLECLRLLSRDRLAAMLWQLLILLGLCLPTPLIADQTEQVRIVFDGKAFSPSTALLADMTFQAFHQTLLDKESANGDATSPKVEGATVHRHNECELCKDMEVGINCCLAELHAVQHLCPHLAAVEQGTHDLTGFERGRSTSNSTKVVLLLALYAFTSQHHMAAAVCIGSGVSSCTAPPWASGMVWPQTGQ